MAKRKRFEIRLEGIEMLMNKLEVLDGNAKQIANDCLEKGHEIITPKAEDAAKKKNLPKKGRYSTGKTLRSVKKDKKVEWHVNVGKEDVGYSIKKGGLAWIFMLYGTPRRMKNKKMWSAFYGAKTKREVYAAQKDIFFTEINRLWLK